MGSGANNDSARLASTSSPLRAWSRPRHQLLRRRPLDDFSGVHDRDVTGEAGRQREVVRDEDASEAEPPAEIAQKAGELCLQDRSSPDRDSSEIRSLGSRIRARAIASRCRSPPLNASAGLSAIILDSPTISSHWHALARRC